MLIVSGTKKNSQKIKFLLEWIFHIHYYVFKNILKLRTKTDEIWGSPTSLCYKTGVIRAKYISYSSSISIFSSMKTQDEKFLSILFFPSQIF